MEELVQHHCKNCGGALAPFSEGKLKCPHCGSVYDVAVAKKHTEQMQELFDDAKKEQINNLRRNLYDAVNAEYVSSADVHAICASLKQYLPDDFQANFYDVATGSNVRQIIKAIKAIDVEKNYDDLDSIILYLIRSMQSDYLLELNNLVERAYKQRDLEKFELYSTYISNEAEKVQLGVYETKLPREVFVAYSSKDMDKVSELVTVLEGQGMKCFVAARNLRHGKGAVENYNRALEEAMDHCRTFVFVSSQNSRSINCDALQIEIPYVQKKDIENSPAEYRNNYKSIPAMYKKPRVEYRIEESRGANAADTITNQFFDGYERVYSPAEVAERIMMQMLGGDTAPAPKESVKAVPVQKKFCKSCGRENDTDARFCAECGGEAFVASIAEFIRESKKQQEATRKEADAKVAAAQKEAERQEAAARKAEEEAKRAAQSASSYTPKKSSSYNIHTSDRSAWGTLFLCAIFGIFGAHRFYTGKKKSGFLYLFTFGLLGVGILWDLICLIGCTYTDEDGDHVGFGRDAGASVLGALIISIAGIALAIGIMVAFVTGFAEGMAEDGSQGGSDASTPTGTVQADGLAFTADAGGWAVAPKENGKDALPSELIIPAEIDGSPVVSIPDKAFAGCTQLTYVEIPDSVKTIGEGAFSGCTALKSITLPYVGRTPTSEDWEAAFGYIFGRESYTGSTMASFLTSDDYNSEKFYIPTGLTDVTVTSAQNISQRAFYNCSMLKTIIFNEGITSFGRATFLGCTSLTAMKLPDQLTVIPVGMFNGCVALEEVTYNADNLTAIELAAFTNCSALQRINSDVDGHFVISDKVGAIGSAAFQGCTKLKELTVPFVGASRNATGVEGQFGYFFGEEAFTGGTAVSQVQPDNYNKTTTYIPSSLHTVTVTDATVLCDRAFQNCSMLSVIDLCDSIESIGVAAFQNCSAVESLSLPSIAEIKSSAFSGCDALLSFEISESVTKIGSSAFAGCVNLSRINSETEGEFVIPDTVKSIGAGAFNECVKLRAITVPFIGKEANAVNPEGCFGYIFGENSFTSAVTTKQQKPDDYNWSTFYVPASLKKVTVTKATQIPLRAFQNFVNVEEFDLCDTITTVERQAFIGCTSLVSVSLPSITAISAGMLQGCTALETFEIGENVTEIGAYAFYGCANLARLSESAEMGDFVVPDKVKSIGSSAFNGCVRMVNLTVPFVGYSATSENPDGLFGYVFGSNEYTGSYKLSQHKSDNYNNVSSYIPNALKTVTVTSATKIAKNAFHNCSDKLTLYINESARANADATAFKNCTATVVWQ